jgi:aspartate racemase
MEAKIRDVKTVLGVLGGMGPLSSAEFLKTIYEFNARTTECEQEAPIVIVLSDPTFPDRTEAFLAGDEDAVLSKLIESLEMLRGLGTSKVVICCMTIHHLLGKLPVQLRQRVVSLLDVIFDDIARTDTRHLIACSTGTHKLNLFQRHEKWTVVKDRLLLPRDADQQRLHELIYSIKLGRGLNEAALFLETLLSRYEADSFVVGCSEIHILAKHLSAGGRQTRYGCIDPFATIAKDLTEGNL